MAQRVNLSPTGLPGRLKTFTAKTEAVILIASVWTEKGAVSTNYLAKTSPVTAYAEKTGAGTVWN